MQSLEGKQIRVIAAFVGADLNAQTITFKNNIGETRTWPVARESIDKLAMLKEGQNVPLLFTSNVSITTPTVSIEATSGFAPGCGCVGGAAFMATCTGHCEGECPKGSTCRLLPQTYGFFAAVASKQ